MTQTTRVMRRDGLDVRVVRTARLEIVDGPERGRTATVARPRFAVGTHASNDLVLADDTVSKAHVELVIVPDGYRVTDLGSSNGTFVDDLRIGAVTVDRAVTLQLGHTRLRLVPERDEAEVAATRATSFGPLVGRSAVMRELFAELEAIAPTDVSLLLEGETGVGKEVVAESVHLASSRKDGPFVVVDCAAVVADLMESELFGHVKGAFTGAETARAGLVEAANGGTLFLDELGELPLSLQAKLLGVLERRQVRRVGATATTPVDVRVIAATNRELAREVNDGRFRADLYYRIAVARLVVPPLRERLDDIPLLVERFLASLAGAHPPSLSAPALARLMAQPWPGNVRELRNAVERAVVLANPPPSPSASIAPFSDARAAFLDQFERRYLTDLLDATGHNVAEAARQAGVERRYFYRLLRRHCVAPARPR